MVEGSRETEKLGDFTHSCQDFELLELEFAGANILTVQWWKMMEGCEVAPGRADFDIFLILHLGNPDRH